MVLHIATIPFGTPRWDESVHLRDLVLRQPLGLQFDAAALSQEYEQVALGAYDAAATLVGVLLLQDYGERCKMRQVAVHPDWQRRGVGQALVAASEDWARRQGYRVMELHARTVAVPFYERLGYATYGPEFEEVGIPHLAMRSVL